MNWRGLWKAVWWTNIITLGVSLLKAELTIRLALWIADPWWCRTAAYVLAVGLMLVFSPFNTWLAWRLQR